MEEKNNNFYKDQEEKERLLDTFPLSEFELDRLILLYNEYHTITVNNNGDEPAETSLSQMIVAQQHDNMNGNNGDDDDDQTESWISALKHVEETIFPETLQVFHRALKTASVFGCPEDDEAYPKWQFLEAVVSIIGRRGSRFLIHIIYDAVAAQKDSETVDPASLISFLYRLILAGIYLREAATTATTTTTTTTTSNNTSEATVHAKLTNPPKAWISSLQNSNKNSNSDGSISRPVWVEWNAWSVPDIIRGVSTFYHFAIFSPKHPFRTNNALQPFTPPKLDKETIFWSQDADILPLSFACLPGSLGGNWYRLYSSNEDGFVFLKLQEALRSYPGATTILIRTKDGDSFGFYTECPWQSRASWFGGDGHDSFLFRLHPSLDVYSPTYEGKECYMYLWSTTSDHRANNNCVLQGLAIGGIADDTPRVHIPTTLENCKASPVDTTYAPGPLLGTDENPFFDIDTIEVWAVNVASESEFLYKQQMGEGRARMKEEARLRGAQVDRSAFLPDFQSGTFMNKLYDHRQQARGRHDFVVAGDHHGYYLENKRPSIRNISKSEAELSDDDKEI